MAKVACEIRRNREAEAVVVPGVATMIVVDITSTAVVGMADEQTPTASFGKNIFPDTRQLPPPRFLAAIIRFSRVAHFLRLPNFNRLNPTGQAMFMIGQFLGEPLSRFSRDRLQ